MQKKDLYYAELYAVDGTILSEKQREVADQYFCCDCSLGEIAENAGMTKQAASDAVRKTRQKLDELENKLHACHIRTVCARAAALLALCKEDAAKEAEALLTSIAEE